MSRPSTGPVLSCGRDFDFKHSFVESASFCGRDINCQTSLDFSRLPVVFDFVEAHCVVAATGQPNYLTARIPVPSRLNIPAWRFFLRDYHDNIVCNFLEYGWPIGYVRDTVPIFSLRTHRGALDYPDSVSKYLTSEIELGRVAGPFRSAPFADGFVISPLNTVEKRDSSERRVIVDLSWPCGSSVNDGILSDSFLGVPIDLHYPTID